MKRTNVFHMKRTNAGQNHLKFNITLNVVKLEFLSIKHVFEHKNCFLKTQLLASSIFHAISG